MSSPSPIFFCPAAFSCPGFHGRADIDDPSLETCSCSSWNRAIIPGTGNAKATIPLRAQRMAITKIECIGVTNLTYFFQERSEEWRHHIQQWSMWYSSTKSLLESIRIEDYLFGSQQDKQLWRVSFNIWPIRGLRKRESLPIRNQPELKIIIERLQSRDPQSLSGYIRIDEVQGP